MTEQAQDKPTPPQRPLPVLLREFLRANNAQLVARVQTPRGELITPENFVPAGWSIVIDVVPSEGKK